MLRSIMMQRTVFHSTETAQLNGDDQTNGYGVHIVATLQQTTDTGKQQHTNHRAFLSLNSL